MTQILNKKGIEVKEDKSIYKKLIREEREKFMATKTNEIMKDILESNQKA